MKENKKIIIGIFGIIIIAIIIFIIMMLQKPKNVEIKMNNETTDQKVVLEEVEFSNITKKYENGITTIQGMIYNNTNTTKNLKIEILLKDEEGKEVGNAIQKLENLEPKKQKILATGITGDYSRIKNIEFRVVE